MTHSIPPETIASIDIGSNTVRLLVVETDGKSHFREILTDRGITRLGEGMDVHRRLLPHRIENTIEVLSRFRDKCRELGNVPIHAVATSAVREAENRDEFVQHVREATGISIDVIPWEEEAQLTLQGVFWSIPDEGQTSLIFDIGGGSTEFILARGKTRVGSVGTKLGIVRLTEKYIHRHPVDNGELESLSLFLRKELQSVHQQLKAPAPERIIGTAGTVTTLAALEGDIFPYDPEKVHGMVLTREQIQSQFDRLCGMSKEERLALKPIEAGREDVLIAGIALVLETLDCFGGTGITVSEYSLREGILLKALGNLGK